MNHPNNVLRACPEEIHERLALFRYFGVEGKSPPTDGNVIFLLQFFNTPGNEIAPRSNIIGKYF
jgi:hypothetical protein